jgi:hypothetical protein
MNVDVDMDVGPVHNEDKERIINLKNLQSEHFLDAWHPRNATDT